MSEEIRNKTNYWGGGERGPRALARFFKSTFGKELKFTSLRLYNEMWGEERKNETERYADHFSVIYTTL